MNLGLRRDFCWPFVVADVTAPIIGADFIRHHDLLIDLRRNRIIDNETKLESVCTPKVDIIEDSIKTFDTTSKIFRTSQNYHRTALERNQLFFIALKPSANPYSPVHVVWIPQK